MTSPLDNALKRRKELQEAIKSSLKELERLEEWIRTYHQLATGDFSQEAPDAPKISYGGHGQTQEIFEQFAKAILRDVGRPMQSGEFVVEFRKRGHPIGGLNETKQAWNKLWAARDRGVLIHERKLGYWLPDVPLTEEAKE